MKYLVFYMYFIDDTNTMHQSDPGTYDILQEAIQGAKEFGTSARIEVINF